MILMEAFSPANSAFTREALTKLLNCTFTVVIVVVLAEHDITSCGKYVVRFGLVCFRTNCVAEAVVTLKSERHNCTTCCALWLLCCEAVGLIAVAVTRAANNFWVAQLI